MIPLDQIKVVELRQKMAFYSPTKLVKHCREKKLIKKIYLNVHLFIFYISVGGDFSVHRSISLRKLKKKVKITKFVHEKKDKTGHR
jgi:hypothetical protein